jgi:L-idonate 5-dehydrogenase
METMMRACTSHGAGDLRVEEIDQQEPGPGQISVEIVYGGICGSDLHYYHRGGVGDFRIRQPLVLGHEVVGRVLAFGPGSVGPPVGTPIAVHPATPCDNCPECLAGHRNVCPNTRYLGSAAHFPHVQGGFSDVLTVPADQVYKLPEGLDLRRAALAEPLAVALHAVRRAGQVAGRRVLVTGTGPIGALIVAVLSHKGAAEIVVTDLVDEALAVAAAVGATTTLRADQPQDAGWPDDIDIAIEASGTAPGLATCLRLIRRRGTVVQLGLLPPGDTPFAGNAVVTREIELKGSFRFDTEFSESLTLLAEGLKVDPILTHTYPLAAALDAFGTAGDRRAACKVLLDFTR